MNTERRERCRSIRAARDWLVGAEHALAGEDDLAGDLKLMLARAELARIAGHRRVRLRRWTGRLLPPLAALAVWAWIAWGDSPAQEEPAAVDVPRLAQTVEERREVPVLEPETAAVSMASPVEPTASAPIEQSAETLPRQPSETMVAAVPAPRHRAPEQTAPAQAPPRMPDADMQRLMQVGGKILRE